jgi:hypothetical protein
MLLRLDGPPNSEPPGGGSANGGAPSAAREARALPETNCMDTANNFPMRKMLKDQRFLKRIKSRALV